MDKIEQLLIEQNNLLRQLLAKSGNVQKLGFSERPPGSSKRIFIGRNDDSCLYTLDDAGAQIPIKERAFTGYLVSFAKEAELRRGEEKDKLNLAVKTDSEAYVISGGFDTCYAQSFLTAIAAMSAAQFAAPITIVFTPGKDVGGKIVWVGVYAPEAIITPPYDKNANIDLLLNRALSVFASGNTEKINSKPLMRGREVAGQTSDNVVNFPETKPKADASFSGSRPLTQYNSFIKRLQDITGHERAWILDRCRAYNAKEPKELDLNKMHGLVRQMAGDYGVKSGVFASLEQACRAYDDKIATEVAYGAQWSDAAVRWLQMIQAKVS